MNTTFAIRLQAVNDNHATDNDEARYRNELSRLEMDISASIKRCHNANDDCQELIDLYEYVISKIEEV